MRNNTCIFLLAAALSGLSLPALASSGDAETTISSEHVDAMALPAFRLARYEQMSFIETRRQLSERLVDARHAREDDKGRPPAGASAQSNDEIRALLDLAEFYLAYVMAPEGLSVLAGLDRTLPPAYAAQRDGLTLALALLDARHLDMPDRAMVMLEETYEGWKDQALFAALYYQKQEDYETAGRYIADAATRMDMLSPELRRAVLPELLDVAVESGDWSSAKDLATRFGEFPALEQSPSYNYLLGRVAETGDDLVSAFDYYRTASAGSDLWAQKARMAIIDLGLSTGTLPKADARILLEQSRRAWSGDIHAIRVLQLTVGLNLEMRDRVGALEVLATITSRYPDSAAAPLARQQARSLWTDFYNDGMSGAISLSAFLSGHQEIAPDYRFEPGFGERTEGFADLFLERGATVIAADEYRETRDYMLVGRDLGLIEVDDAHLDLLQLKHADALYRGGQLDEVSYVVAEGLLSDDPALQDRLNLLKAKLYTDQNDPSNVVQTALTEPTLHYLRLKASAYFGEKQWDQAKAAYEEILERSGGDVRFGDAIRLLLAAHRAGDKDMADALVQRFPDLTESPQWLYIARGFTEEAPALLPLREAQAQERVERAGKTLQTLDTLEDVKN